MALSDEEIEREIASLTAQIEASEQARKAAEGG
jgi:hypothetical protein